MSSINRAIQAMELLARKGPLGVRAVAQQLSLPVGSVHRMLLDLEEERVAERTPDGGWVLSNRLFEITGLQLDRVEFPRLAHPFCERIAEATRETVNVNVVSGITAVCVDKVRGNEGMQLDWRIGSRGPLYCGGAAKAILAYMSEAEQERVLAEPMPAFTPTTFTDPKALKAPGPEVMPVVDMLNEACGAVSRRLGYSGDWPPLPPKAETAGRKRAKVVA